MSAAPWRCEGCGWTNVGYVTACDGCGEDRATAVFDRGALLAEIGRYRRSLLAHHEISTLSEDAIRESVGGPCKICARANKPATVLAFVCDVDENGGQG